MTLSGVVAVVAVVAGALLATALIQALLAMLIESAPGRVPALLYHRLLPLERVRAGEISDTERVYVAYDARFAEQMEHLARLGYTAISMDDYLAWRRGQAALPPKSVIITFDDGFMSNYLYAYPVLRRLGMKATIFVTPDPASANFAKYAAFDRPLTPDQMREMSGHGISIQSHGMTHRYLTDLDEKTIRWELLESRRALEAITGQPVRHLAIPSGAYSRKVRRLAGESSYQTAFCMLKGSNGRRTDPLSLRRLVVARYHTAGDLGRLLEPRTRAWLRIVGFWQGKAASILGMKRLDELRRRLSQNRLGRALLSALRPAGRG